MAHGAENAVLGCFLLEGPKAVARFADLLKPEEFHLGRNQAVYAAILKLHAAGRGIDIITVEQALRNAGELELAGGPAHLALLVEQASIAAYLDDYVVDVREAAARREVLRQLADLEAAASNGTRTPDLIEQMRAAVEGLADRTARPEREPLAVGLADFFAEQALTPDPDPLIEGILSADGGGLINGENQLGKSTYGLEEAACLALAAPVCGRFKVPERRRVLFMGEEDTARRTCRRVRAIIRGKGLDPDDERLELNEWFRLAVWKGIRLDDPAMLARVEAEHANFRPAVAYYDSLRKITRRDLNKAHEAEAFLDTLDNLRRKYGTIPRVICHARKLTAGGFRTGRGSQEVAGSFVLGAWAEAGLYFEPIGRQQGAVRVTVQSKDWAPLPPFRLVIESTGPVDNPDTLTLRAVEDQATDADDLVLQAVATLPTTEAIAGKPGVTVQALAAHLKRSTKTIRRAVGRLEDAGRIVVTGKASKQADLYVVAGQ